MSLPADFIYVTRSALSAAVGIHLTPDTTLIDTAALALDGISTTTLRPCLVKFRSDIYCVGCYSRPIYYPTRDARWVPVGIAPPPGLVAVAAGTGSGGSTGTAICYVTHQHRIGDVLLAESNPSNFVQLDLTGQGRAWSGLAGGRERRVTHVAGYVSMNGSNYRRAFLIAYGASTYTENVPTPSLTIEGPEDHYLPPNGVAYATEFAGRMWYASTSEHPYRVWFSFAGEPQYVGLAAFRDTLEKDPIVGMRKCQNVLVVFSATTAYAVRSYGDVFVLEKLDSSVGLLTHFGIVEIHNKLWFPSHDGYFIFDGAGFSFVMKDMRPYWLADRKAYPEAFAGGFAVDDRIGKNLVFYTMRQGDTFEGVPAVGTVAYVANYLNFEASMRGVNEQPDWSIDIQGRITHSAFYGLDNVLYLGGPDGEIRAADETDGPDDEDTAAKPLLIEGGHLLFQEPGDDVEHGKRLDDLWCYIESETSGWSVYVLMGDEWASRRIQPDNVLSAWKADRPASALAQAVPDPAGGQGLATYIPETTHYLGVPEGVTGRGLTMRFRAAAPIGLKFRGYGGIWSPGAAPRHERGLTTFQAFLDDVQVVSPPPEEFTTLHPTLGLLQVLLSSAGGISYPVTVDYVFSGDFVATYSETLTSGLLSAGVTIVVPGADPLTTTLTVSITSGGVTATRVLGPLELFPPTGFGVQVATVEKPCPGGNPGVATVAFTYTVSGPTPTPPYTYNLVVPQGSNPDPDPDVEFSGVAGTSETISYTLTVTDSLGVEASVEGQVDVTYCET